MKQLQLTYTSHNTATATNGTVEVLFYIDREQQAHPIASHTPNGYYRLPKNNSPYDSSQLPIATYIGTHRAKQVYASELHAIANSL